MMLYGNLNEGDDGGFGKKICENITHATFCCYKMLIMNTITNDPASLFVCFVALRPKSTAMVMAGWSVHLTTLFPVQA